MRIKQFSKFLGKLELAVMKFVWQNERVNVRDVLNELNKGRRKLAYTTVMTVMNRLTKKGWLTADKEDRTYLYSPVFSPQDAEAQAVSKIVRELVHDHGHLAIAQFMKEVDKITPEQLRKLSLLADARDKDE